ncbi:MAG: GTPase, partial [bacterium]
RYYPGEVNVYRADVIVINKIDTADPANVDLVLANVKERNPGATIVRAASPLTVRGDASQIKGKRVLCVEDGPTLTHGEMKYGAAVVAAKQNGAGEILDPRPFAVGTIKETFEKYPGIGALLPAMGYGDRQVADLTATIDASDAELVVVGTPIDLTRVAKFSKPSVQVSYSLAEQGTPTFDEIIGEFVSKHVK